jgi:hypothetical protein
MQDEQKSRKRSTKRRAGKAEEREDQEMQEKEKNSKKAVEEMHKKIISNRNYRKSSLYRKEQQGSRKRRAGRKRRRNSNGKKVQMPESPQEKNNLYLCLKFLFSQKKPLTALLTTVPYPPPCLRIYIQFFIYKNKPAPNTPTCECISSIKCGIF